VTLPRSTDTTTTSLFSTQTHFQRLQLDTHLYTLHNTTHPTKRGGSLKGGRSPGGPRRLPEQSKRFLKGGITCSILHSAALLAARLLLRSVLLAV
jgi:hypothetical protein